VKSPRTLVAEFSRKMAASGLVVGSEGNLSVRVRERIYTTPTGAFKGELTPEEVVVLDLQGRVLEGGKPSSELPMHLAVYRARPEVCAVVHAHPPYTVALSLAGFDFARPYLAEAALFLRQVVTIPFAVPGTEELPEAMKPHLPEADVFVLSRHGAVTLGRNLAEAFNRMCILEQVSRVTWLALSLNPEAPPLSKEEVEKFTIRHSPGAKH